jgi:Tol biopolymer transport system component
MTSEIDTPVEAELRSQLHTSLDGIAVDDLPWPHARADIHHRVQARRRRIRAAVAAVATASAVASILVVLQSDGRRTSSPPTVGTRPWRVVASAQFPGTDPPRIALGDGYIFAGLWDSGRVDRLDPVTLEPTGSADVGSSQDGPLSLSYGAGSLWVLNFADARLWRIDPATLQPTMKIKLGGEPSQVAFGDGQLWVTVCCATTHTSNRQRLLRINPNSGTITGSIALPGDGETINIAVEPHAVLVGSQDAPVSVLDPQTLTVQRQLHDSCDFCDGAPGLAIGEGSFYVTSKTSVLRFAESTGRLIAESPTVSIGSTATPLALAPDGLWLTSRDALLRLAVTDLRVTDHVQLRASSQIAIAEPALYVSSPGRVVRIAQEAPAPTPTPSPTINDAGLSAAPWARDLPGEVAVNCGSDICLMRPDGTGERPLFATFPEWDPEWSPDGHRLVFRGYYGIAEGDYAIYTVGSDGCHVTRIPGTGGGYQPTWSTTGTRITFAVGGVNVINTDGTGLHKLTRDTRARFDAAPAWSAADRIAFARTFHGRPPEIYAMNPDGSHVSALTQGGRGFTDPAWSPDGRHLAFVATTASRGPTAGNPTVIEVANADGSDRHTVSPAGGNSFDPSWTPDGRVVFLATSNEGYDAYLVNADGTNLRRLYKGPTNGQAGIETIAWGPAHLDRSRC